MERASKVVGKNQEPFCGSQLACLSLDLVNTLIIPDWFSASPNRKRPEGLFKLSDTDPVVNNCE